MTADPRQAYEAWHAQHGLDRAADTPWYQLVRSAITFPHASMRILEIGCGRGGFSCWLATQNSTSLIVAADFSMNAVRLGQRTAQQDELSTIKWAVADITTMPFPADYFDLVISCETL